MAVALSNIKPNLEITFNPEVIPAAADALVITKIMKEIFSSCDHNSRNNLHLVCKGFHTFLNNDYSLCLGVLSRDIKEACRDITESNRSDYAKISKIGSFRILLRAFTENKLNRAQSIEFLLLLKSLLPTVYNSNFFSHMITNCQCKIPDITGYNQLIFPDDSDALKLALRLHVIDRLPSDLNQDVRNFINSNNKNPYLKLITACKYPQLILEEVKSNLDLDVYLTPQGDTYYNLRFVEMAVGASRKAEDYKIYEKFIHCIRLNQSTLYKYDSRDLESEKMFQTLIKDAIEERKRILCLKEE